MYIVWKRINKEIRVILRLNKLLIIWWVYRKYRVALCLYRIKQKRPFSLRRSFNSFS